MAELSIQQAFDLALLRHGEGRWGDAEEICRQILARQPEHSDAIHLLGLIAHRTGRNGLALELIRRTISLRPNNAEACSNLGKILAEEGKLDEAIAACRKAIALKPALAAAYNNLGTALKASGLTDQSIAAFERAVALNSKFTEAHFNLGNALRDHNAPDRAIAAYEQVIALNPNHVEAINNLGNAYREAGQFDEAAAAYRRAIAIRPDLPEAHNNLGNAMRDASRIDESIAAYRQGIALRPDYAKAESNLGNALRDAGRLDESIAAFRRAIALNPDLPAAHGNLIYTLHFHSDYDAQAIAEEHREWNRRHALREPQGWPFREPQGRPLRDLTSMHENDRNPDRRLRIGYVSPDFCKHPVGRFLAPLMEKHDRANFEIICYSDVRKYDALTERIRSRTDVWRNIVGMTDETVAARIREDRIDILIDLTMHMAGNRLLVFAHKPAPVQVTYLAYCSTTGLDAMDYRLTDPFLDPSGKTDQFYVEKSIRLPETYWCYEPGIETPEVGPLPAESAGHITFGCLNNFAKMSPEALATWIELLRQLPTARLTLHARQGEHRLRTFDRLRQEGIDPARLTFVDFLKGHDYFRQYNQIDIALDPFPYAGGTTTCDGMWMGVPVITLAGRTAVGRGGVTLLNNVGLPELVAQSREEYVSKAVELATDLPRLANVRAGLRERMLKSPLTDAPKFARSIEAAYRQMWRRWCETIPAQG